MNALRPFAFASFLATLGLAAGCPSVPGECRSNIDCPSTDVCRANECVPSSPDEDTDAGPDAGDAGGDPVDVDAGDEDAGPPV